MEYIYHATVDSSSNDQKETCRNQLLRSEFGQNVFRYVERLHKNLGHPSTEVFVRMLAAAKAREEVIACARRYSCAI
eukprot:6193320-Pyramimonas_sp.AAC.1